MHAVPYRETSRKRIVKPWYILLRVTERMLLKRQEDEFELNGHTENPQRIIVLTCSQKVRYAKPG